MRAAVKDQAELIAVSYAEPHDLTYGSDQEMEKAYRAICLRLDVRCLRAAARRGAAAHRKRRSASPGAHPLGRALLRLLDAPLRTRSESGRPHISHVIGEGHDLFEIVGVAAERFTGTEPGTVTDIFVPAMMHRVVNQTRAGPGFGSLRVLTPGAAAEPVRRNSCCDAGLRKALPERPQHVTGDHRS